MFSKADHDWMRRALDLAQRGLWTTTPNPRVGCVIVRDGEIVGEGWHRAAGEPHAEVLALAQAGDRAKGATVYVTLEPCSHFGRTPPCVNTLIEASVSRVVAAMEDPNPMVDGRGLKRLRDVGIDVRCGLLERDARALNPGFISRLTRGRPWVRLKLAASLDGFTALPDGRSQWITGEFARHDGHRWRARACAILTGIGTVKDDDPILTVRGVDTPRQPLRVLVDSRLEVDPRARILASDPIVIAVGFEDESALERVQPGKLDAIKARGHDIVFLPGSQGNDGDGQVVHRKVAPGKVDLPALMRHLADRGVNELHVEAGENLNGSMLFADLVDELLVYIAPKMLGEGRSMFRLPAAPSLDGLECWEMISAELIGEDACLRLQRLVTPPVLAGPSDAI